MAGTTVWQIPLTKELALLSKVQCGGLAAQDIRRGPVFSRIFPSYGVSGELIFRYQYSPIPHHELAFA